MCFSLRHFLNQKVRGRNDTDLRVLKRESSDVELAQHQKAVAHVLETRQLVIDNICIVENVDDAFPSKLLSHVLVIQ